jgi:hypothetical protein
MADDDSSDFKWNDTDSVVVRQQDAIARAGTSEFRHDV